MDYILKTTWIPIMYDWYPISCINCFYIYYVCLFLDFLFSDQLQQSYNIKLMSVCRAIPSWEFTFIYIQMMSWKLNVPRVLVMALGKERLSVMLYLMQMESLYLRLYHVVKYMLPFVSYMGLLYHWCNMLTLHVLFPWFVWTLKTQLIVYTLEWIIKFRFFNL